MTSDNLLIGTIMEEACWNLEDDQEKLKVLSASATIHQKIYTVVAYGIQVTRINTASQITVIVKLNTRTAHYT